MAATIFGALQLDDGGLGGLAGTPMTGFKRFTQVIDVASVAPATSAEQTFTVAGLLPGDVVTVVKPSLTAGLDVGNVRVSAANTLAITFVNATAAAIDPAAETYILVAMRF